MLPGAVDFRLKGSALKTHIFSSVISNAPMPLTPPRKVITGPPRLMQCTIASDGSSSNNVMSGMRRRRSHLTENEVPLSSDGERRQLTT